MALDRDLCIPPLHTTKFHNASLRTDFKHFSYCVKTEVEDLCVVKPDGKHPP